MRAALLALVAAAGCGGARVRPAPPPAELALDGDASGLVWDGALYVSDSAHDRLLRWDGGTGFAVVAQMPVGAGPGGLGQPVKLQGGGFLVPRFGHGEAGGLYAVAPDGTARALGGLDPKRKRVGLAVGPDGTIYEAYFTTEDAPGAIATVAADGSEKDLVPNLGKPIGLQIREGWLYFSDQAREEVRRCKLPACEAPAGLAPIPGADLFAVDRAGALFVGTADGSLWRVGPDGARDLLAKDLGRVRGVAIDDDGDRIFVAGRRAERAYIRVMPLGG